MPILDPELKKAGNKTEQSAWQPSDEEREAISLVLRDFALGYQTMYRPRQEFNDLSVIQRDQVDYMAFNTYQPNNGEPAPGDAANSWRSQAIRPIERNKALSMAGHMAERLGFLRLSAGDQDENPDDLAATVMNGLVDWARATYFTEDFWLHSVLQLEASPTCIVHMEYRDIKRPVKTTKGKDGKWNYEMRTDEELSGEVGTIVQTDQLFIENIFEPNIQKQRFVIWRRIMSHDLLKAKYSGKKNWEHVKKGYHLLFNDANQGFYYAYDTNLRDELGEEVLYFSKDKGGLELTVVNGIIIGEPDAPMTREDGLYPFAKGIYSMIRPNFFYGKSLVFAVSHDANIINTLYPVLVDGAILDTIKPMQYIGKDVIGSDVIVPGGTVTLRDPNSKLAPIMPPLQTGNLLQAMNEVERSINQTASTQAFPAGGHRITAYEMSAREKDMQNDLLPFMSELVSFSAQLTRLLVGDLLQYATVGDVVKTQGTKSGLKYKSFVTDLKDGESKAKVRKIKFEKLPDLSTGDKVLDESYKVLAEQGGMESDIELIKADPVAIRNRKYKLVLTDEVLRPKSTSLKFQENLATLDKAIAVESIAPGTNNLRELEKALLFSTNPITARNPDRFMKEEQEGQPQQGIMQQGIGQTAGASAMPPVQLNEPEAE